MPQSEMIQHLLDWCHERGDIMQRAGAFLNYGVSAEDGRPKQSAWVTLERGPKVGDLVIWSSGEAELGFGHAGVTEFEEHHQVEEVSQLNALLERLLQAVCEDHRDA